MAQYLRAGVLGGIENLVESVDIEHGVSKATQMLTL